MKSCPFRNAQPVKVKTNENLNLVIDKHGKLLKNIKKNFTIIKQIEVLGKRMKKNWSELGKFMKRKKDFPSRDCE
ncbi:CLUMA_CG003785, isoform A [Clunio marinus]|uniref:CLUMA_CG003785, isoform A n=1 Tax=Clunio marinus TaxID=568069 RepID=A0A1J1HRA1_9DIPT|nr:CLUMA_CG003785, isoform A [Clunio marinus]